MKPQPSDEPVLDQVLRELPPTYSALRFHAMSDATKAVAAVQSLVDSDLGSAFRQGPLEARIYGSNIEWEPVLYFSKGAIAAARLAGVSLPQTGHPVVLEEERHTSLLAIPRAPVAFAADVLEAAASQAQEKALRVMIVEDHQDTACALADLVELWGCRAAIAPTGRDARRVAERFHPRVVLLDLGLPDEHGYEVAADLKQRYESEKISFVVVTGWTRDQTGTPPVEGIAHHLVKPVDADTLKSILDGVRSAA
jgi:CheY-like chemotaxis protein